MAKNKKEILDERITMFYCLLAMVVVPLILAIGVIFGWNR